MSKYLWAVYNNSNENLHGGPGFFLTTVATSAGMVSIEQLESAYRESFNKAPLVLDFGRIGNFDTVDQLRHYCYDLACAAEANQVNLYFAPVFQEFIQGIDDIHELSKEVSKHGELIEITLPERKGLLNKIFN